MIDSRIAMRGWLLILAWFGSAFYSYGQDGYVAGPPRLAYWQVGKGLETVVVLHGGPGAPHQYLRPEFDALSKTARVIYYDQRGCGKSDSWTSYSWQGHVTDLKRLISTVAKNQKVFLAGSSWGSILAILYAYTNPQDVKGLILSGTIPWHGDEENFSTDRFFPTVVLKLTMTEKRIITRSIAGGQVERDTVEVSKESMACSGSPQSEPILSLQSAPKVERLKQIQTPILLFNGTRNRGDDWAHEYAKLFPNVQFHTLPEAEHDPWFSDPDLFFSLSNEFIRNISK